jgi:hypothetical protein
MTNDARSNTGYNSFESASLGQDLKMTRIGDYQASVLTLLNTQGVYEFWRASIAVPCFVVPV